jgi:polar amino acid transport system substrate-binding protein
MDRRGLRWPLVLTMVVALLAASCGDDDDDDGDAASTTSGDEAVELELVTEGTLTVGTELPAPPFWIGEDYGSIEGGFEYDLASEMAERLGLDEVEVVQMPFAGVVSGQECPCDIDFSQVTITPERAEAAQFTEPYFDADQGILASPGVTVESLEDAKAIQWGAQIQTTGLDFITGTIKPDKEPRTYDTTVDAFTALKAGQIDAVMLDTPIVLGAVDAGQVGDAEVIGQFETGEQYGAIVNEDSPNLDAFNEVLAELEEDGTLSDLLEEYFGGDPADIPFIDVE